MAVNQANRVGNRSFQPVEYRKRAGYLSIGCGHVCTLGYFSANIVSTAAGIMSLTALVNYVALEAAKEGAFNGNAISTVANLKDFRKVMQWPHAFSEEILRRYFNEKAEGKIEIGLQFLMDAVSTSQTYYYLYLDPLSLLGHTAAVCIASTIAAGFLYEAAQYFYGTLPLSE